MNEEASGQSARSKGIRYAAVMLGMVLLAGIVAISILREAVVERLENQVTVNGEGRVPYQPDMAILTLGVQVDKIDTAENALRLLNETVSRVIPAIKGLGIAEKDIQTQSYSLSPQYDYIDNVSIVAGYNASQALVVTVQGISQNKDLVSRVIAEAARSGANQVTSITFSTTKLAELKQQARLKAIDDAKNKAGVMAQAAGVRKLGRVVGWYENVVQSPETPGYFDSYSGMGGKEGMGTPQVPSGTQEIVVEVGLSYQIR